MRLDAPGLGGAPLLAAWRRGYRREWLPRDLLAGVTLAAYAVPVSLAYASLAGLPPQVGLLGYVFGAAYALFGSSRHLALGPTAAVSLTVGATVGPLADGDPARAVALASLAAILAGIVAVSAWALRLGHVVNFISETVLAGFKVGAALVIASTQLPKLFALPGGGNDFFERMLRLAGQLPDANLYAVAVGGVALVLLLAGERLLPGRPVALGVVALAIVAMSFTDLAGHGVKVVGVIPGGLPMPALPNLDIQDLRSVFPLALAAFLLAHVEGISAARTFALKHGYRIDPDRELLGLGAANLAVALGHGYPVAGGMSQSAVNEKAGARSPLSLVVASAALVAVLLFLTGLLRDLPDPVLAAIVLTAVKGLVSLDEIRFLRRVSRAEFRLAVVALLGVLLFGILQGVLLAAILTLLALLRRGEHPPLVPLGRIPGTDRFRGIADHPEAVVPPRTLVARVDAALLYFNVENARAELLGLIERHPEPVRRVIVSFEGAPYVDVAGARMLASLHAELAARGIALAVAEAGNEVREVIRLAGLEPILGPQDRRRSVAEVVDAGRTAGPWRAA